MEVILKKDVEGLGQKHDTVKVKDGYGRNFLIPQQLAVVANAANKKMVEEILKQTQHKLAKLKQDAEALAEKLSQLTVTIAVRAGEKEKVFGTVTPLQIAEAIKNEHKLEVSHKAIQITAPIKTLGTYDVAFKPHKEVSNNFKLEVVAL